MATFDKLKTGARMAEISARREATQPVREETGGSTSKNPPATPPGA